MDEATRERIVAALAGSSRLHVGCGFNFAREWINVGLFEESFLPYGCTTYNNGLVLHLDVTKEFPFEADTLTAVYASHFIEHFGFEEGLEMVRKFRSVMAPGGILRLTFPDLELWIRKYTEKDSEYFKKYYGFFLDSPKTLARTNGEIFMSMLHGWGHKWGYDFESMQHLLELAGFRNIERRSVFDSRIDGIRSVESNWEGRVMETCYVEAEK